MVISDRVTRIYLLVLAVICLAATANASVTLNRLFSDHMVMQRDKTVPVYGTATPGENVTVTFNGQSVSTAADAQGKWQVNLAAMSVSAAAKTMTVTGTNSVTVNDVLIGDVWLCSGQSNMEMVLNSCNRQTEDVNTANFPGIRQFYVPPVYSAHPTKNLTGNWNVCTPSSAGGFGAVGFYYARKIYQDQSSNIPIGLLQAPRGSTSIDPWLAPEGASDIPVLSPLYTQSILPWGPFSLFNGTIYPIAPYAIKGAIWYQGESGENSNQSADSYYLKEKALIEGWKRLWGGDDLPFYLVQLTYWGTSATSATPETGGWALIRDFQTKALAIPHTGMAVTTDIGDVSDIHPKDKLDVGERLALWALKNDYGRTSIVPSGPILRDVSVSGSTLVCSFDYVGSGLMVGSKTPYQPTAEAAAGTPLARFSIAGSDGNWVAANAVISGNTVVVSAPNITAPRKVAYAYWQSPVGANLYNKEGLPASPFYVDDATVHYSVTASAGTGGSISPAGTTSVLKRSTLGYTITPDTGYRVLDVKVDGTSVGAVGYYTFDPIYGNHSIAATFTQVAPTYTISASSSANGSITPSGPISVTQGGNQSFNFQANAGYRIAAVTVDGVPVGIRDSFRFGDVKSNHSVAVRYAAIPTPGTGTGLTGDYYSGANFDTYKFTRVDPRVYFEWYANSPDPSITTDQFSVRWTGLIEPQFTETYTFHLQFDDGARLWVNNQLIIDQWGSGWHTTTGTVNLTAGQKVPFKLEYCDSRDIAVCKMDWESYSLPRETVPTTQLYPGSMMITASAGVGGTISPSGNVSVDFGTNKTFTIAAASDYAIADVKVDGVSKGAISSYTFENVQASHTISATFAFTGPVYMISASAGTGGTISPSGNVSVNRGANQVFTFTPDPGYAVDKVIVDNVEQTVASSYTFSSVQTNHAIAVSFKAVPPHTITATAGDGGSISPSGSVSVVHGASQVFTITPNVGYAIDSVTVDGVSQGAVPSYTFSTVTVDHTISATFVHSSKLNGTIIGTSGSWDGISTKEKAFDGDTATYFDAPAPGTDAWVGLDLGVPKVVTKVRYYPRSTFASRMSGCKFQGSNIADFSSGVVDLYTIPGTPPVAWSEQVISNLNAFRYVRYLSVGTTYGNVAEVEFHGYDPGCVIAASAGAGGSISPNGEVSVTPGASQTFTITPNSNYAVNKVVVDGVDKGAITSYTFSNVQANHSITASFVFTGTVYTITASAGQGGTISPSGSVAVNGGENQTFTFTPDTGYVVDKLTVDGADQTSALTYTFSAVAANHAISVTFKPIPPHTIAAFSGQGGSISPSGNVSVVHGTNQTFTFSANSSYSIDKITVDGVDQPVASSYTFTNVVADHTITVTYKNNPPLTITASAGSGGSISPSGAVSVNSGSNQPFTITPDAGYIISGVMVDGASVGAVATYTFTNVVANHTISASFTNSTGGVPRTGDLFASWVTDSLPSSGTIASWASYLPTDKTLVKMGTPTVATIDGVKWASFLRSTMADGFDLGAFGSWSCNGASYVMAIKPVRVATGDSWTCLFDIGCMGLSVGVLNNTGSILVFRKGVRTQYITGTGIIPDGQKTILSFIFQNDGSFKIYANGVQIVNETSTITGGLNPITPNYNGPMAAGSWADRINMARTNGAGWSVFNGYIGDTYIYNVALTDAERLQLESLMKAKFVSGTVKASAGTGGAVMPSGSVAVEPGETKTFAITPAAGYVVTDVEVDGASIGAVRTYTFSNVSGSHTISAKFGKLYGMNTRSLLANSTLAPETVVRVCGKVISTNLPVSFVISDGHDANGITINANGVTTAGIDDTKTVVVTGTLNTDRTIKAISITTLP